MEKENKYWSPFSQKHQPTHWPFLEKMSNTCPVPGTLAHIMRKTYDTTRSAKHVCIHECQKCLPLVLVMRQSMVSNQVLRDMSLCIRTEMLEDDIFFESYFSPSFYCHMSTLTHWVVIVSTFLLFHCSAFLSSAFVRFPYPSRICVSRCGRSEYLCIRNGQASPIFPGPVIKRLSLFPSQCILEVAWCPKHTMNNFETFVYKHFHGENQCKHIALVGCLKIKRGTSSICEKVT